MFLNYFNFDLNYIQINFKVHIKYEIVSTMFQYCLNNVLVPFCFCSTVIFFRTNRVQNTYKLVLSWTVAQLTLPLRLICFVMYFKHKNIAYFVYSLLFCHFKNISGLTVREAHRKIVVIMRVNNYVIEICVTTYFEANTRLELDSLCVQCPSVDNFSGTFPTTTLLAAPI